MYLIIDIHGHDFFPAKALDGVIRKMQDYPRFADVECSDFELVQETEHLVMDGYDMWYDKNSDQFFFSLQNPELYGDVDLDMIAVLWVDIEKTDLPGQCIHVFYQIEGGFECCGIITRIFPMEFLDGEFTSDRRIVETKDDYYHSCEMLLKFPVLSKEVNI